MQQAALILTIICAYVFVWMLISYLTSRKANDSTFFNGNRKMPWLVVAIAMIGAPMTGVTFISVPGMVANKDFSYVQMGLGFIVGYFVIAFILIPLYYRLNIVSIYGFLQKRFGNTSYKTGAWLFLVSKVIGISIRFLVVCTMLQFLVFEPLGIPYVVSVGVSLLLVWCSTYKGGVRSVVWSDVLKSFCLISTVILCLYFILSELGVSASGMLENLRTHENSKVFFFDDPMNARYFWKQFIAGIFIVIAMTGLDQDMMQRTLACKNAGDSKKNLILSSVMQFVVNGLLLILGLALLLFAASKGIDIPEKTDNLFATVAFHSDIPMIVGCLFILGIVSATFSSVGSALTAMTTSMTIDVLQANRNGNKSQLGLTRKYVHTGICILLAVLVIFFYYLNEEDAISTVYTVISYTDGPILGLFLFGILTKRQVNERYIPIVCILAPVLAWGFQWGARYYLAYETSFELLIINASLTFVGMAMISSPSPKTEIEETSLTVS